jgi:hypothetical protein
LARDPVVSGAAAIVEFADSLDLDYKQKASLARSLALSTGAADWVGDVFDHILQLRVSTSELDEAIARFEKGRP